MKNCKFSIIMPAYNAQFTIHRAIESVLNLKYKNWELIIINDGSKDDTLAICQRYLYDNRIKIIDKNNGGVSSARNKGLDVAEGDYVIFLDSDDCLRSDICDVFIDRMSHVDFCIGNYTCCYENGNTIEKIIQADIKTYNIEEFKKIFPSLYLNCFFNSPWAKCYKRKLIDFKFEEEINLGEDFLFNLNYLCNCRNISLIEKSIYFYKIYNSGSLSSGLIKNGFANLTSVYSLSIKMILKIFGEDIMVIDALSEKYIIDILTMIERYMAINKFNNSNDIRDLIKMYNLEETFICASLKRYKLSIKIKVFLMKHKLYLFFFIYMSFILFLKNMGGKSYARKSKSKDQRDN
ncbi:MAG: glycosyltransferase family A protein [Clostridia bacterium]|nr:glycosyltransferase family A protein [Clostridia bacterium]